MALDLRFSELPAVAVPLPTDEFAVNQDGESKKVTRAQIHTLLSGEHLSLPAVNEPSTPTLAFGAGGFGFYRDAVGEISVSRGTVKVAGSLPAAAGGFEVNNTLTGVGLERVLTVSDFGAGFGVINADINTATPPTTEAVTANFEIQDLAGDDILAQYGFDSSNTLRVKNFMHGGDLILVIEDSSGIELEAIRIQENGGFAQIFADDGDVANPVYSFLSTPDAGMFINVNALAWNHPIEFRWFINQLPVAQLNDENLVAELSPSWSLKHDSPTDRITPCYASNEDSSTGVGFGNGGEGELSVIADGVEVARADSPASGGASQFLVISGNSGSPGLAGLSDPDTGFRWTGANEIIVSNGGSSSWHFLSTSFFSDSSEGPALFNIISDIDIPTVVPNQGDSNTGIGGDGSDILTLIAGGITALLLEEESGFVIADWDMESNIVASITQTQGQRPLLSSYNSVSVVANPNDVVTMPAAFQGRIVYVINRGANDLQVFPDTGDNLGFGIDVSDTIPAGETRVWLADNNSNWFIMGSNAGGASFPLLAPDGSAGAPSYSFTSETGSGLYLDGLNVIMRAASGNVEFEANATDVFRADDTGVSGDNASPTWYLITDSAASSSVPVYAFNIDSDTGIGRAADDQLSLIAGSVEGIRISETAGDIQVLFNGLGSASAPLLAIGEVNTGVYYEDDGGSAILHLTLDGTERWALSGNTFYGRDGAGGDRGAAITNLAPTATTPSIRPNTLDLNTGIGQNALDQLSLITGGVEGLRITSLGGQFANGNEGTPGITFIANPNLGFYRSSATQIGFSSGGSAAFGFNATQIFAFNAAGGFKGPAMQNETASATNPTLLPDRTDLDTGIGWQAADNLSLIAGGLEAGRFEDPADLAATETSLWLYDLDAGAIKQVTVGANDSGGAGFKLLRVAN